jgi:lambda family phage portal protein
MKLTEREIAVGLGLPASIFTGDLSDVNYSSIRAGLVEFRCRVAALQHGVIAFQALRPIWRRWATTEVLSGRVNTTVDAALPVKFITPKQQWVDPAKDVQAELDAIAGGLMSRREAVTSRGVDIEALDAEIAADNERAKALGLTFTNPNRKEASDADPVDPRQAE